MRKSNLITNIINAAIFIVLEVAALNMLSNNGPLQGIWFSRGAQNFMGAIWGGSQDVKDYFSLKKINDALSQENEALKMRLTELEAIASESGRDIKRSTRFLRINSILLFLRAADIEMRYVRFVVNKEKVFRIGTLFY